jgi:hypothetical protein
MLPKRKGAGLKNGLGLFKQQRICCGKACFRWQIPLDSKGWTG